MKQNTAPATKNDAESATRAQPPPIVLTSTPPTVGPSTLAALLTLASIEFAFCSPSGRTSCGTIPLSEGPANADSTPVRNASPIRYPIGCSVSRQNAIAPCVTPSPKCVTRNSTACPTRSPIPPPISTSAIVGSIWALMTKLRSFGLPVSCRTAKNRAIWARRAAGRRRSTAPGRNAGTASPEADS